MKNKLIKIINIVGFVLLFAGIVYIRTKRKIDGRGKPKIESAERSKQIMEDKDEQMKKMQVISNQKEQQQRDSVHQLQRNKMEEQQKKTEEILKALDKEIEEKEN